MTRLNVTRGLAFAAIISVGLSGGIGLLSPSVATAQTAPDGPISGFAVHNQALYRMLDLMGIYEVLNIMGTEYTEGAAEVEAQMFAGAGGATWQARVTQIYAPDRMIAQFEDAFAPDALTPQQIETLTDFARSDAGDRIIAGELAARRSFLDTENVDAAIAGFVAAVEADNPRLDILRRFNTVNGLVERNVSGALNLRIAFYRGLIDGGAFAHDVPEQTLLSGVWAQEPEMRRTTIEWLYAFQLLAYADITDAELEDYVTLSESAAGRAINAALFSAFDVMLADLSYELGVAAAIFIAGEDT